MRRDNLVFRENKCCEKNDELRQLAYSYLCRLGLTPKLSRKRNGKKKLSATKVKDLDENPTELLQRIFENQQRYISISTYFFHTVMVAKQSYSR